MIDCDKLTTELTLGWMRSSRLELEWCHQQLILPNTAR